MSSEALDLGQIRAEVTLGLDASDEWRHIDGVMNAVSVRVGRGATILAMAMAFAAPASAQPQPAAPRQHESAKSEDFSEHVDGAEALEGRIIAPCCWTQTIDIHGSEISTELRREIRQRLKAGESQDAITADLVNRYGERILAVPPGNPLKDVGVLLSLAFGLAGIGAGAMLLRWRKRAQAERAAELDKDGEPKKKPSKKRDRFDDEIDAELEKL